MFFLRKISISSFCGSPDMRKGSTQTLGWIYALKFVHSPRVNLDFKWHHVFKVPAQKRDFTLRMTSCLLTFEQESERGQGVRRLHYTKPRNKISQWQSQAVGLEMFSQPEESCECTTTTFPPALYTDKTAERQTQGLMLANLKWIPHPGSTDGRQTHVFIWPRLQCSPATDDTGESKNAIPF